VFCAQSEDLFSDGVQVMQRVQKHLNLAPFAWETVVATKYNVGLKDKAT
jgi:hypothetical protein